MSLCILNALLNVIKVCFGVLYDYFLSGNSTQFILHCYFDDVICLEIATEFLKIVFS